ncbi:uncharacterized protein EV420DRAFT_1630370 [Desarmillaria tabescens]|uniref:GST N-terminal domain-containing protein n=1 Tax=Armillaria tabescens TaxID=1929756 RepID=A0AA39MZJ4_ARMTA|nr:uncharacterized protein EV420DRAFT_1630370 [Desarmillaria tabescens]KAK0452716.1 hypothetical protein EV420DRAFT_1630370 [Desarmillaria tabescens]
MSTSRILYDIPSTVSNKAWSPNVWKARYVLNYKGLPYRTEWVDSPTSKPSDGVAPHYTLPLLHDHSTGASVSESAAIARYLDKTYPETPVVIPAGTNAEEYFRRTREANTLGGKKLEDTILKGEERVREWAKLKTVFGKIDAWYGKGDMYVMEDIVSYANFMISAYPVWFRILYGADSEEWEDILTRDEGRWGVLVKDFQKYETVV